jgi:uncharacterized protein (DUF2235 family)
MVVCCDGTGQKLDVMRTNVVRLSRALDLHNPDEQVAFYDPGVGTMPAAAALTPISRRLTLYAGFLVGFGLLEKVANAYEFIIDRYASNARIYLFGFSRGAFTVRLLAGLLHRIGVLRPDAKNLIPYALELYGKHYTHIAERSEREQLQKLNEEFRDRFSVACPVNIPFLGVWDTVKAFGFFRPRSFPHVRHNPSVQKIRHAIALDERRGSYMFTSWGGLRDYVEEGPYENQDVRELWFAGDHSDVGGGHPEHESGLSWRAFRWMVGEACQTGLKFDHKELVRMLPASLENSSTGDQNPFYIRHNSLTLCWRLVDLIPRPELENAPPRSSRSAPALHPGLTVPFGWPRRPLTWPISGDRDLKTYYRDDGRPLLFHRSVQPLVEKRIYALDQVSFDYVDDAPLPPS